MTSTPIIYRPVTALDRPILADSWARTFAGKATKTGPLGDRWVTLEPAGAKVGKSWLAPNLLHAAIREMIDGLLEQSQFLIGCLASEPAVVLCWCAFEPDDGHTTLHYVWTRPEVRRRGYATGLLRAVECLGQPGVPLRPSHLTRTGQDFIRAYRKSERAAA